MPGCSNAARPDAGPPDHLAIVITFDEDENSGDITAPTTVIAPTVHHVSAATPLTDYSLTRYLAELAGTTPRRGSHRGHR
jgi:hypothetical protein